MHLRVADLTTTSLPRISDARWFFYYLCMSFCLFELGLICLYIYIKLFIFGLYLCLCMLDVICDTGLNIFICLCMLDVIQV